MKRLIKQTSKSFYKKIALTSTMVLSVFTIVFLGSSATSLVLAIDNSYKRVTLKGNNAQLTSDFEPNYKFIEYETPSIETLNQFATRQNITTINPNGVDFDNVSNNIVKADKKEYYEGGNYIWFPNLRNDFVPLIKDSFWKPIRKNLNYQDPTTWLKYGTTSYYKPEAILNNSVANKIMKTDTKHPYITGFSFIDPNGNLVSDIRNIVFSTDENNPVPIGYLSSDGIIEHKMSMFQVFASYSSLHNPNWKISDIDSYSLNHSKEQNNELRIYAFEDAVSTVPFVESLASEENVNSSYYFNIWRNIMSMPKKDSNQSIPLYVPFKEKVSGYKFTFKLNDENLSPEVKKFKEFLKASLSNNSLKLDKYQKREIKNMLEPSLTLTQWQALGMSENDFNSKTPEQQNLILSRLNEKLLNFQIDAQTKINSEYVKYSKSKFRKILDNADISNTESHSLYYQDIDKNQFLFVEKNNSDINKIIINTGRNLLLPNEKYHISNELESVINYLNDSKNGEDYDLQFLMKFLSLFNQEITKDGGNVKDPNFLKINEKYFDAAAKNAKNKPQMLWYYANLLYQHISQRIESTNNFKFSTLLNDPMFNNQINPYWYAFKLKFSRYHPKSILNILQNSKDINILFQANQGFDTAWQNTNLTKSILMNNMVVVSTSYFEENRKKVLPKYSFLDKNSGTYIYSYEELEKKLDDEHDNLNDKDDNWNLEKYINSLPSEYVMEYSGVKFLICGSGISPEYAFPIISFENPIPNPKDEGIVYVNAFTRKYMEALSGTTAEGNLMIYYKTGTDNSVIEKINMLQTESLGEKLFNIYSTSDSKHHFSLNTIRESMPNMIKNIIIIGVVVILSILVLIILYVLYLLLKMILSELKVPFAIARANGMSNFKIFLSVFLPTISSVSIITTLAFVMSHFLKNIFNSTLSSIWFLPIFSSTFNFPMFLIILAILFSSFALFIWILLRRENKKPVLSIIDNEENVKNNFLTKLVKKNRLNIAPIWKLRTSFFLSNISRILVLTLLISTTFSLSASSIIFSSKVNDAKIANYQTKKYNYAFDLDTPTEATGLYKVQEYGRIGIEDKKKAIYSNLTNKDDPYYNLAINGNKQLLALRNERGQIATFNNVTNLEDGFIEGSENWDSNVENDSKIPDPTKVRYYTNYVLPSYSSYLNLKDDTNLLFNSTLSAFIMDISLDGIVPGVSLGTAWDNVKNFMPQELAFKMDSNLHEFKKMLLDEYGGWSKDGLDKEGNPLDQWDFAYYLSRKDLPNKIVIDQKKTVSLSGGFSGIRLRDDYLKFLGTVFYNKDLMEHDIKITAGVVPFNKKDNETYTYLNANLYEWPNLIGESIHNKSVPIKIRGIKPNSKFVYLQNDKYEALNNKLVGNNIVVNLGSSIEYNLRIGSKIKIKVTDSFYDSSRKIAKYMDDNYTPIVKDIELTVSGISTDSIGSTFYINQNVANEILDLNDPIRTTFIERFEKSSDMINSPEPNFKRLSLKDYQEKNPDYLPFNGVFTSLKVPYLGNNAISLFSNSGLYSALFSTAPMINRKIYFKKDEIARAFSTKDLKILKYFGLETENPEKAENDFYNLVLEYLKTDKGATMFIDKAYNTVNVKVALNVPESKELTDNLFLISNQMLNVLMILILSIFVTILIATMIVVILSIINDLKRILANIKLLGYSEWKIIRTILYILLPVVLLSLMIGTGLIFGALYLGQILLFKFTSVVITNSLNGVVYGLSILILLSILSFCSLFSVRALKRAKLNDLRRK